ncbi:MAG TPA: ribose-phosphate diphosphokinase [Chitinophagales bacterium]|nr:ribose-phosphate diphosphokinase [Chitinophagales bacterium]
MKIIFTTENYRYFQSEFSSFKQFEIGKTEFKKFPDGEEYLRLVSNVEGRDVAIIGGTISEADTLELYDLASAITMYGAKSLTMVIPFFGYSTMERALRYGEAVTAKYRARLISSIPKTPEGNKVVLMDIHSEGIPHYFENDTHAMHLYCKKIILEAAREMGGNDFILGSTDAGRAKWVESLANDLGVNAAFILKRRISGEETKVLNISADVKQKKVILYDDMIRTGGSLINAARAYTQAGATEVSVIATHGLFVSGACEKLKRCGFIKQIICTNTHPAVLKFAGDFVKVKSVASLIAENI